LEQKILAEARRAGLRLIGPNCLGVMLPPAGLNASLAKTMGRPGSVAFISQSGAFATAILDWSKQELVGFSAFMSVGSMLDVSWGDLIAYFGKDYRTKSIVIQMESVGEARSFLSAAREVAFTKPIIIIKGGRTEAAAKAAASHTGALIGSDEVLDAAFRQGGVLRVDTIADLFAMAEVLGKQPRPQGPRLLIVTNAGGPGVLATDVLFQRGGTLADLSPETVEALNQVLPKHWSHGNPIDIIGDAGPERYAKVLKIAAKEPNSNGLLVILTPQNVTNPTATAQIVRESIPGKNKPVLASWMGGTEVAEGKTILNQMNIPTFSYPDTATRVFAYMWRYTENLQGLYETPTLAESTPNRQRFGQIIEVARQAQRTLLSEVESKQLLTAYDIASVETRLATSEAEAIKWAAEIGYPVVLKLHSETITHKTEVGGVQLNLYDAEAVHEAFQVIRLSVEPEDFGGVTVQPMLPPDGYELILGSTIDPQFGPVILFGLGGQLVEVFKDQAVGLPPLTSTLARRMMEQTRIFSALQGVRGRAGIDLAALEQLMVRFSHLIAEQRWIKEIEINPLFASPDGLIALDARVVLHPPEMSEAELPKLAIRPYPLQYVSQWQLKDGRPVTLRPIRAEDEPLVAKLHETLSDESVYSRFFRYMPLSRRVAHERLSRICFVDYDLEIGIVMEYKHPETEEREILGIGRLIRLDNNEAEFAVLVSDNWQRQGIGSKLLTTIVEIGRQEKLSRIIGTILPENYGMQRVSRKVGFEISRSVEDRTVLAAIEL
jgi:acetyltransferase